MNLHHDHTKSMSAISQLLLNRFLTKFKGRQDLYHNIQSFIRGNQLQRRIVCCQTGKYQVEYLFIIDILNFSYECKINNVRHTGIIHE